MPPSACRCCAFPHWRDAAARIASADLRHRLHNQGRRNARSDRRARVRQPAQWTIIFYANQDRLGTNVSLLIPGFTLRIPCVGGGQQAQPLPPIATTPAQTQAPSEASIIISSLVRRIEFLTADGF